MATPNAPGPTVEATFAAKCFERNMELLRAQDLDAYIATFADDYEIADRQPGAQLDISGSQTIENVMSVFDLFGNVDVETQLMATRGSHVCAHHVRLSGRVGFEVAFITVDRFRADGCIQRSVFLAPDAAVADVLDEVFADEAGHGPTVDEK